MIFSCAVFINADCLAKYLTHGIQGQIFSCSDAPFDERDAAVTDFNAGDAGGVHAASGIAVGCSFGADHGTVCMSGNEQSVILDGPVGQDLFRVFFSRIVFGGAGRIWDSELFERAPDIADQETGKRPERAVQEIGLMSVCQTDIFLLVRIF